MMPSVQARKFAFQMLLQPLAQPNESFGVSRLPRLTQVPASAESFSEKWIREGQLLHLWEVRSEAALQQVLQ